MDITEDDTRDDEKPIELVQETMEGIDEFMTISLQAFIGVSGYQTIGVIGYHEKSPYIY